MRLPNADRAIVDPAKITEYLLSESHPDGGAKAAFFMRFGFHPDRWRELADRLRRHGAEQSVTDAVESEYGTRYHVDGPLETPDGRNPSVRTVWIVPKGQNAPRLITAFPKPKETTS